MYIHVHGVGINFLTSRAPDARIYMEVVPALLGLARALQKSSSSQKEAFNRLVESKGGVATEASKPHPPVEKSESGGLELDLDVETISMLLTTVSVVGGPIVYNAMSLCVVIELPTIASQILNFNYMLFVK